MVHPCPRPMLIKILCFILVKKVVCLPMEQDLQEDELIEQRNMIEKSCFHPYHRCRTDKECSPCQKRCNSRTSTCYSYTEEAPEFSEDVQDEGDADEEECYLYSPCTNDDDCKACNLRCGWWIKSCRQTLNLPNLVVENDEAGQ